MASYRQKRLLDWRSSKVLQQGKPIVRQARLCQKFQRRRLKEENASDGRLIRITEHQPYCLETPSGCQDLLSCAADWRKRQCRQNRGKNIDCMLYWSAFAVSNLEADHASCDCERGKKTCKRKFVSWIVLFHKNLHFCGGCCQEQL